MLVMQVMMSGVNRDDGGDSDVDNGDANDGDDDGIRCVPTPCGIAGSILSGRGKSAEIQMQNICLMKHRKHKAESANLRVHKDTTLLSLFRASPTSRICFGIMLLSTAATVHGVLLTADQQEEDSSASCTHLDLSSASGPVNFLILRRIAQNLPQSYISPKSRNLLTRCGRCLA
ncbi:unnamed protein product [Gongylonema pulchrum]|uniref:Secreted protein n=1 Tax=Gongylonema pulchrum TaxID=637853 RepID=A0A183DYP1_9BILA|nr:unnamed protein product [Gongylonema pulchrum]